jgi:short-subunit dehydrogenase
VDVEGRAVLVTGASSGIGAVLAERLAAQGAVVGLVARREERLAEVLDRCRRSSPRSRMWVADLGDLDRAEAVALEADEELGGLDVVVHNAAIPKRRRVTALTAGEVEGVMRVNFLSPVRMTLALLPRMVERDAGVIVNVSSLGGRLGIATEAAYSASKFALCGWSESLAQDLWGTGVEVRLIIPGAIATEIWDQPDNDPPLYDGPLEPPQTVADGIIAAIEGDRFEHYLPDLKAVVEFKTGDPDAFFASAVEAMSPADGPS